MIHSLKGSWEFETKAEAGWQLSGGLLLKFFTGVTKQPGVFTATQLRVLMHLSFQQTENTIYVDLKEINHDNKNRCR